jgi:hypothetical protein
MCDLASHDQDVVMPPAQVFDIAEVGEAAVFAMVQVVASHWYAGCRQP